MFTSSLDKPGTAKVTVRLDFFVHVCTCLILLHSVDARGCLVRVNELLTSDIPLPVTKLPRICHGIPSDDMSELC